MKKQLITAVLLAAAAGSQAVSYQSGKVSEVVLSDSRVTFQIEGAENTGTKDAKCAAHKKLNFVIEAQGTALAMFDVVLHAKKTGLKINVSGTGDCAEGGEFETVDTITF